MERDLTDIECDHRAYIFNFPDDLIGTTLVRNVFRFMERYGSRALARIIRRELGRSMRIVDMSQEQREILDKALKQHADTGG